VITVTDQPTSGLDDHEVFDLMVLVLPTRPVEAAGMVRTAWRRLGATGTLLVGIGPAARTGLESLAASLNVKPCEVANAPGWLYLHRRM